MWVIVYSPETNEEYLRRELAPDDLVDERKYADEVADLYGVSIAEPGGWIPSCSGDIRVEFRDDPDNSVHIWSGESFFFEHE